MTWFSPCVSFSVLILVPALSQLHFCAYLSQFAQPHPGSAQSCSQRVPANLIPLWLKKPTATDRLQESIKAACCAKPASVFPFLCVAVFVQRSLFGLEYFNSIIILIPDQMKMNIHTYILRPGHGGTDPQYLYLPGNFFESLKVLNMQILH